MCLFNKFKQFFLIPLLGLIFATSALTLTPPTPVYAEPNTSNNQTTETTTEAPEPDPAEEGTTTTTDQTSDANQPAEDDADALESSCYDQAGGIGWLICPVTNLAAKAIDSLYSLIEDLLAVQPLTTDDTSPIYTVWEYARNISNILFVILILVIIYSQVTGLGLSNYGIKKTLPRIIIAAILVNLSFLICSLAVDTSNIIGASLRGFLDSIAATATATQSSSAINISVADLFVALTAGGAIAGLAVGLSGGLGAFLWMLIPVIIGGLISLVVGLLTISLRQAVVALLIMISPLAFVAYLLPNTESWFKKWLDIFKQMLIFYPMFSLLFGASRLAGWTLISSANGNALWVILGVAVQILPLFFALSLMKMSGSVLGAISGFLGNFLGNTLGRAATNYGTTRREAARLNHAAHSNLPSAHLQRYLRYRQGLRDAKAKDDTEILNADTTSRVERRVAAGYNPSSAKHPLRSNRYTRARKQAGTATLEAQTAAADTAHALNNYGDLYGKTRAADRQLADRGSRSWIEFNRSQFAAVADDEADIDYMVNQYLSYAKSGQDSTQYQRYITSVAGPDGQNSVLGQVLQKASAVEQRRRKGDAIMLSKYGLPKGYNKDYRNMLAGYYINDQGFATDAEGNRLKDENGNWLEMQPGEILTRHPDKIVVYDKRDENGDIYADWYDQDGEYVSRIYRKDSAFIKEALANFDMSINDPINEVYSILTGIREGDIPGEANKHIGLAKFSTTVAGAILSNKFKDKAAWTGPMFTTSVGKRQVQNISHLNLERLDGLIKTVKPGAFNVQDSFEFEQLAYLMDPDNWERAFTEEELRSRVNVNGEPFYGLDENGNKVKVEDATYEELMRTVKEKYLFPAAQKMTQMLSRASFNVTDNLKPGAADNRTKLEQVFAKKWQGADLPDPYEQQTDTSAATRHARERLHVRGQQPNPGNTHTSTNPHQASYTDHQLHIDQLYADFDSDDGFAFAQAALEYLASDPSLARVYESFDQYVLSVDNATPEEYYNELTDIFAAYAADF